MKMNWSANCLRFGFAAGLSALALATAPVALTIAPASAYAEATATQRAGSLGQGQLTDTLTWSLSLAEPGNMIGDVIITISGTGAMPDYTASSAADTPWLQYNKQFLRINTSRFKHVVIEEGVTRVGSYAFTGTTAIEDIEFPSKMDSIGMHAFSGCTSLTSWPLPDELKTIEGSAFYGVPQPDKLSIPNGIETIGMYALPQPKVLLEYGDSYPIMAGMRHAIMSFNNPSNIYTHIIDYSHIVNQKISQYNLYCEQNGGLLSEMSTLIFGSNYDDMSIPVRG